MPRPKLRPFNKQQFASIVHAAMSVTRLPDFANDPLLAPLMPSAELTVDSDSKLIYQGRAIADSESTYRVVASAVRVEVNNRITQVTRIKHALAALRVRPLPFQLIELLDELLTVYKHMHRYLSSLISLKE